MKTWLAFWASGMHQPNLNRLQQVNDRRLYSNLSYEIWAGIKQGRCADGSERAVL